MILTKYADYSIRVLIHLAKRPGKRVSIATIADEHDISRNHLMKVSQNLARHGYIIGYRGKGGGIMLARPARTINMGELLQDVERHLQDSGQNAGHALDAILNQATRAFVDTFSAYTLSDFLDDDSAGAALISDRDEGEDSDTREQGGATA